MNMAQPLDSLALSNTLTKPPSRLLNRKYFLIAALGIIGALILAVFGQYWFKVGRFLQSTDDAYVGGDVTVISTKVAGYIDAVVVTDNQKVRAGDVLIKLDDRDYRAALARAEAAVAAQQASLANFAATRHLQESVIDQAKAGIAASAAETLRTRDDQLRYQNLVVKAAVSVQLTQKADAEYKVALANAQKASANLTAAQRQLTVIDTQKLQAEATLAQTIAERDIARLNLGYTEIRAPLDGTVGNRRARSGAFANAGAQLLAVVPARGLWIDANFKENQLAHMREGQAVIIKADVLPDAIFHGHVASLAPATGAQFSVLPAENATGNFTKIVQRVPVRIQLDGDAALLAQLRPGLSVRAEVDQRSAGRDKS